MTTEERFERIEHFAAAWREESRRELAEHRGLWRETQRQINEITRRVAELSDRMLESEVRAAALREEMAERDRRTEDRFAALRHEMAERDRKMDERMAAIGRLVERGG
jgi:hypothetical protein